ncbi:13839_t:CDS:2 [Funneliformis caledonium]|uniref:13839_t:CDS:1 n=1 Tax=Funneliformis caledonium TaxID=1117310 RepID=A0A9N8VIH1_9GLOM|nr:13839_t:CDS:2 [Funneliformis caledonium]
MEQNNGTHLNVKALLYFAVMSVFLRASLIGPFTTSKPSFIPSLELAEKTNDGVEFDRVAGLLSTTTMDNNVFGVILAALLNDL